MWSSGGCRVDHQHSPEVLPLGESADPSDGRVVVTFAGHRRVQHPKQQHRSRLRPHTPEQVAIRAALAERGPRVLVAARDQTGEVHAHHVGGTPTATTPSATSWLTSIKNTAKPPGYAAPHQIQVLAWQHVRVQVPPFAQWGSWCTPPAPGGSSLVSTPHQPQNRVCRRALFSVLVERNV